MVNEISKILITLGIVIFLFGMVLYFFGNKIDWFGNLFGDIKIIKSNYGFYFPITSMIVVSIILTILINLFSKFFK